MTNGIDTAPFAIALGDAIAASGYSLAALHRRLQDVGSPVSVSTLSYWRSGARRPEGAQSSVALAELERILSLEPGALTSLTGATRRPGQAPGLGSAFSDEYETTMAEVLAALAADPAEHLRELSSSTVAFVGEDGALREFRTRCLVQATTRSVRSVAVAVPVEESAKDVPRIVAIGGVRVAAQIVHPSRTMIGARLELDAPVDAPATTVFEFGVVLPEGYPPQFAVGHGARRRASEMVVWVQFAPERVPDWVAEFDEDENGERELARRRPDGPGVHVIRRRFGPGYFGLTWGYDDEEPERGR